MLSLLPHVLLSDQILECGFYSDLIQGKDYVCIINRLSFQ
jgi:hypothetical protein